MERCLYWIHWRPRAWNYSVEHTSFDQAALTHVSSVSRLYLLLGKRWASSSFPLSSQCVQLAFCWLERLKHLADSTLRAVESVSAWLSAWRRKTRQRGKLGQGCKVWAGIWHLFLFPWSSCRKNHIRLSVSMCMCVVLCLQRGSQTVALYNKFLTLWSWATRLFLSSPSLLRFCSARFWGDINSNFTKYNQLSIPFGNIVSLLEGQPLF